MEYLVQEHINYPILAKSKHQNKLMLLLDPKLRKVSTIRLLAKTILELVSTISNITKRSPIKSFKVELPTTLSCLPDKTIKLEVHQLKCLLGCIRMNSITELLRQSDLAVTSTKSTTDHSQQFSRVQVQEWNMEKLAHSNSNSKICNSVQSTDSRRTRRKSRFQALECTTIKINGIRERTTWSSSTSKQMLSIIQRKMQLEA